MLLYGVPGVARIEKPMLRLKATQGRLRSNDLLSGTGLPGVARKSEAWLGRQDYS